MNIICGKKIFGLFFGGHSYVFYGRFVKSRYRMGLFLWVDKI